MRRRDFLQRGGALLFGAAAAANASFAATNAWSAEFLTRYRRLRFAMHEDLFFWWLRGTKFGVIDARVTALYNMEIASIFRCRATAGAGFSVTSLELVYNTDIHSGEPLNRWLNPYTAETVNVPAPTPVGPVTVPYGETGPVLPTTLPGATMQHQHRTEFFEGDAETQLLRDESVSVVRFDASPAREFVVSDLSTYQAAKRDLANRRLKLPPAIVAFNAVSGWQRWMNMGERPGQLLSRGVGRKVARLDELPRPFLNLLARFHPDIQRDPAAALDRPAARFDR